MAIEVPVRKEIAAFESRPVFGMTARQLICCGVAIPLAVGSYLLFKHFLNTSAANTITILVVLPIFAFGLFKKDGYTLEKYLKIVWEHRYTQQKTLYTTENAVVLYMPEDEYKNDLAKIILNYSDKATTAQAETNITYHLTEKEERQGFLLARAECRAAVKLHRAYCRQHEKDLRILDQRDRRELAHLRRQGIGDRETNITYHPTEKQEQQGFLLARAECRAAVKLHRAYCRQHEKDLRILEHADRRELAHLRRQGIGDRETNITYHLTGKQERQGFLLARAECRAAANAHRTACRLRQKRERTEIHGDIHKGHRAEDEAQGAQTGPK